MRAARRSALAGRQGFGTVRGERPVRDATLPDRRAEQASDRACDVRELGWEAGIRTPIPWSRATCPTVGRPPSTSGGVLDAARTSDYSSTAKSTRNDRNRNWNRRHDERLNA